MDKEKLFRKAGLYFKLHGNDPQALLPGCVNCKYFKKCSKKYGWKYNIDFSWAILGESGRSFCVRWMDDVEWEEEE